MADKYILAHDLGTSSDKAILVTLFGEIIDSVKCDYPLHHPQPGYAEQNPQDWWKAICSTTKQILDKTAIDAKNVVGITFSSQMQCLIPINKDGLPLCNGLTWLDGRSADIIRKKLWIPPRVMGYNLYRLYQFLRITGGCPGHTGKDQIGKILWLRTFNPDVFNSTYKFIDTKDFVIFKLTNRLVTSADLAVIWWMLDTRKNRNQWHKKLCKLAGISVDKLADVRDSAAVVGELTTEAAKLTGLLPGTPVINGAGDLSAAALGSGATDEGEMHISIGTSGWVAGHFTKRRINVVKYAGCIGSCYPQKYYLAMAHQETAGLCLEWFKNKFLDKYDYKKLNDMVAKTKPGADGVLFTPWLFGERCPLNDDYIRAGFFNLSLNHSKNHLLRAVYEGIALNTRWAMETLENLYQKVTYLNIIGGGAKSDVWCQIFADITNRKIQRVEDPQQAGAKGIALLASMSLGYIKSFSAIKNYIKIEKVFLPNSTNRELYDKLFFEYKQLYKQNKKWHMRMNKNRFRLGEENG